MVGLETLHGVDNSEDGMEGMHLDGGGDSTPVLERLPDRECPLGVAFSMLTLRLAVTVAGRAGWVDGFSDRVEFGNDC